MNYTDTVRMTGGILLYYSGEIEEISLEDLCIGKKIYFGSSVDINCPYYSFYKHGEDHILIGSINDELYKKLKQYQFTSYNGFYGAIEAYDIQKLAIKEKMNSINEGNK